MRILQEAPLIGLYGEGLDSLRTARIERIAFGAGLIAVHMDQSPLTDLQTRHGILASLSCTNKQIEALFHDDANTDVSASDLGRKVIKKLNVPTRVGFAKKLFGCGVYSPVRACNPLTVLPHEQEAVEHLIEGHRNPEIGELIHRSPGRIGTYITEISHRTAWHGREQIALAALLSGEFGVAAPPLAQSIEAAWRLQNEPTSGMV